MKLKDVIRVLINHDILKSDKLITIRNNLMPAGQEYCYYCNQIDCACKHNSILRDLTGLAMTEEFFIDECDNHMTLEEIAEKIKL
jgi:hypothetical protein